MNAVMVAITNRPEPKPEIEVVTDLEDLMSSDKCSCSAGDDQPY